MSYTCECGCSTWPVYSMASMSYAYYCPRCGKTVDEEAVDATAPRMDGESLDDGTETDD